jgi:methyltransferase-like protein/SAM-dependent methyltransferase
VTGSSYDDVPYSSFAYPLSHPDRLGTIGRLFGMQPAEIEGARVLELGCASGGNLIPMAEQLPEAQLLGVDLSSRQIEEGAAAIRELDLRNVTLRHADLQEIDASWGRFDYVLCHGVFSWVPPHVQDRILEICAQNLAPQGIAFISYNTYPGWHVREAVRHMMRFHVAQFPDARKRTEQAGALVDFLASSVADEHDLYAMVLRRELDILARTSPDYLFHEHLEEHNAPCYFHQFAERLGPKGLAYLGEADVHTMLPRELAPEVAETLGRISPDIIVLEQYMDFVRNRQFRQTLVCRAEVPLTRNLRPELVPQFFVGFAGNAPADIDLAPGVPASFETADGLTITSALPITKAALALAAARYPDVVAFDELCRGALEQVADVPMLEHARELLAVDLLACFLRGTIELHTARPRLCVTPGSRPMVSRYARWQTARGGFATNRRHMRVDFDEPARRVIALLNGERDRDAVTDALVELLVAGTLTLTREGEPLTDPSLARAPLAEIVERTIANLAAHAMLIA